MDPEFLVEIVHSDLRHDAQPAADPFNGDGARLLGLHLRIAPQARFVRRQQHLEVVDTT